MTTETELRLHRCCFTGHRPEKLHRQESEIRAELEETIRKAIADGFSVFITGMARGVDLEAGEIVLRLRSEGFSIRLICAVPYPGFENSWGIEWQQRYSHVITEADLVRYISPRYNSRCFQKRNEWMVNHSARVIAVFNGHPSGTKNTVDYAYRCGVPIMRIEG